jgi:formylglycine-generating enzyme required for sulfatase activity
MHPQVFISYAEEDAEIASRLRQHLERQGIGCWMAPGSIEPGADYDSAIVAGIEQSSILVLVLSTYSNVSRHVHQEVRLAFQNGRRIVPMEIEPVELSNELGLYVSTPQRVRSSRAAPAADLDRLSSTITKALGELELSRTGRFLRTVRRNARIAVPIGLVVLVAAAYPWVSRMMNRRTNAADGQRYVWIPPGEFRLGCSSGDAECEEDERPAGRRVIAKGFWLAATEATAGQWNAFARTKGLPELELESPEEVDLPVIKVTRDEAIGYCEGVGGRLPTETEWEYAARGGVGDARYGRLPDIAWYAANSEDVLHRGGEKRPNAFGLYDVLGNVWEWTSNRYFDAYDAEGEEDTDKEWEAPREIPSNGYGTVRGGSIHSNANEMRVSNRFGITTDLNSVEDPWVGIRCARDEF